MIQAHLIRIRHSPGYRDEFTEDCDPCKANQSPLTRSDKGILGERGSQYLTTPGTRYYFQKHYWLFLHNVFSKWKFTILILQTRRLRLREVKHLIQKHRARKGRARIPQSKHCLYSAVQNTIIATKDIRFRNLAITFLKFKSNQYPARVWEPGMLTEKRGPTWRRVKRRIS